MTEVQTEPSQTVASVADERQVMNLRYLQTGLRISVCIYPTRHAGPLHNLYLEHSLVDNALTDQRGMCHIRSECHDVSDLGGNELL